MLVNGKLITNDSILACNDDGSFITKNDMLFGIKHDGEAEIIEYTGNKKDAHIVIPDQVNCDDEAYDVTCNKTFAFKGATISSFTLGNNMKDLKIIGEVDAIKETYSTTFNCDFYVPDSIESFAFAAQLNKNISLNVPATSLRTENAKIAVLGNGKVDLTLRGTMSESINVIYEKLGNSINNLYFDLGDKVVNTKDITEITFDNFDCLIASTWHDIGTKIAKGFLPNVKIAHFVGPVTHKSFYIPMFINGEFERLFLEKYSITFDYVITETEEAVFKELLTESGFISYENRVLTVDNYTKTHDLPKSSYKVNFSSGQITIQVVEEK